jgi:hypothetical protein
MRLRVLREFLYEVNSRGRLAPGGVDASTYEGRLWLKAQAYLVEHGYHADPP